MDCGWRRVVMRQFAIPRRARLKNALTRTAQWKPTGPWMSLFNMIGWITPPAGEADATMPMTNDRRFLKWWATTPRAGT